MLIDLWCGPDTVLILHARTDDEQMEAAVAEARRRRWPEFATLFETRDPASQRPFIVKAPCTSGEDTEHMWIVVTPIEGDAICGTLAPDEWDATAVLTRLAWHEPRWLRAEMAAEVIRDEPS